MKQTVILVSEHVWSTISPNTNPWARHRFARLTASIARVLYNVRTGTKFGQLRRKARPTNPALWHNMIERKSMILLIKFSTKGEYCWSLLVSIVACFSHDQKTIPTNRLTAQRCGIHLARERKQSQHPETNVLAENSCNDGYIPQAEKRESCESRWSPKRNDKSPTKSTKSSHLVCSDGASEAWQQNVSAFQEDSDWDQQLDKDQNTVVHFTPGTHKSNQAQWHNWDHIHRPPAKRTNDLWAFFKKSSSNAWHLYMFQKQN